jgi:hypothetical protein
VSTLKKSVIAVAVAAMAVTGFLPAHAQSTDGFHSIQIFPVVVDSAAFTQRFTFTNPDLDRPAFITPRYFPGVGTTQAAPLDCPPFTIPKNSLVEFTSLREICPALAAGSQFGYLYTNETNVGNRIYAAFSRVSNPSANGFSVEAFPAHTFTSADVVVTGLRRLSAGVGTPAFQSNCFLGKLKDDSAPDTGATRVDYTVRDNTGTQIGASFVDLAPGRLTRLLDVFAAAGAPAGDYNDATITFHENGTGEPGLMTFCTVQDNSSFGADFRIAKQEMGKSTPFSGIGSQDDHVSRNSTVSAEAVTSTGARAFAIPAGQATNTHVMYFRHPDWVQCEIIDPATLVRALPGYGLEMRLVAQNGTGVIAGGAGSQGFGKIYLGDKADRNNGANTRYSIQVESNGANEASPRPYRLHCQSGSGHTMGDLVRYQTPGNQF